MSKTLILSKKIKMIISDFDGVFTDGSLYIGKSYDDSYKKVSYKDVMGVSLAIKRGLKVAIISGEKTPAIDVIAQKFALDDVFQDIRDKATVVASIMAKHNFSADEVVYLGDDVNDIEAMKLVNYRVAPKNAVDKVKQVENIQISENFGAEGVFREVVDNIIEI